MTERTPQTGVPRAERAAAKLAALKARTAKFRKDERRKNKPRHLPATVRSGRTQLISLRLPHDVLEGLDKASAELEADRTGVVKAVLRLFLADNQKNETLKRLLAQKRLDARQAEMDLFG